TTEVAFPTPTPEPTVPAPVTIATRSFRPVACSGAAIALSGPGELEWNRSRTAGLATQVGDLGPVGYPEGPEALEQPLDGDVDLQPGQVRPDAAVRSGAERQMTVVGTIDVHLVGMVKNL